MMTVVKLDADKIRKLLLDAGMSWSTFALKAGVNPNNFKAALMGEAGVLPKTAKRIADEFGLKTSDIASYVD